MMGYLIAFFFSGLFLAITFSTILKEFPKFELFFANHSLFTLFIPSWSFFAPIPGMHDYILRFRYFGEEKKKPLNWIVVQKESGRPLLRFIWNPQKRFSKALFDVINDLIQFNTEIKDDNQLRISLPYLQLLNFISGQKHCPSVKYLQFSISKYSRIFKEELLFQSDIHPIEPHVIEI